MDMLHILVQYKVPHCVYKVQDIITELLLSEESAFFSPDCNEEKRKMRLAEDYKRKRSVKLCVQITNVLRIKQSTNQTRLSEQHQLAQPQSECCRVQFNVKKSLFKIISHKKKFQSVRQELRKRSSKRLILFYFIILC